MLEVDLASGKTFGPGSSDVVLPDDFQHGGSCLPCEACDTAQGYADDRHYYGLDMSCPSHPGRPAEAYRRQPVMPEREEEHQHDLQKALEKEEAGNEE